MYIDLLPVEVHGQIQVRAVMRRWITLWSITAICGLALFSWHAAQLRAAQQQLAAMNQQCLPVKKLRHEMELVQQQLVHLRQRHQLLLQIQPADHLLDLLGIIGAAMRPTPDALQIQRLSLVAPLRTLPVGTAEPRSGVPGQRPTEPNSWATLSLQGVSLDDPTLSEFINQLRSVGVFEQVDLKSSTMLAGEQQTLRSYQLECRYEAVP